MRRFSQKNHLVTLNEINITPLLDLAFVLLIIFVITTPMLEQNLHLTLPKGGAESPKMTKDHVRTVEVNPEGGYVVKGRKMSLADLREYLTGEFQRDPELGIILRVGDSEAFGRVSDVLELCRKMGHYKVTFKTSPDGR